MIDFEHTVALAAFILIASITPGPNNLMLMASGTNYGFRRTLPHLSGVCLGVILMIVLVELGISKLFELYPASTIILKTLCTGYLLYLAYKIATAPTKLAENKQEATAKPLTCIQAILFQWVNPKAWAMCISILSVYRLPDSFDYSFITMVAIFTAINIPCITLWAYVGTHLKRILNTPKRLRIFNITCAIALIGTLIPIWT